jgi:hypothetical protein
MDVVPSIILAKDALDETIDFIRKLDALNRSHAERSLREEIEFSIRLKLTDRAIECLRTACAAHDLKMVVIDPRTQLRHVVPAAYFDQRSFADLEFASAFFRGIEHSKQVVADPLYKLVRPYRGWVHGFIEPKFRAWLENPTAGPQGGPRMRPYFHMAAQGTENTASIPRAAPLRVNRSAYETRVAEFQKAHGRNPPIQTTKTGVQGDREWAVANGVSRPDIERWRRELLERPTRGAPQKFGRNFGRAIIIRLPN